jgi:hypothetical protein
MDVFTQLIQQTERTNHKVSQLLLAVEKIKAIQQARTKK